MLEPQFDWKSRSHSRLLGILLDLGTILTYHRLWRIYWGHCDHVETKGNPVNSCGAVSALAKVDDGYNLLLLLAPDWCIGTRMIHGSNVNTILLFTMKAIQLVHNTVQFFIGDWDCCKKQIGYQCIEKFMRVWSLLTACSKSSHKHLCYVSIYWLWLCNLPCIYCLFRAMEI